MIAILVLTILILMCVGLLPAEVGHAIGVILGILFTGAIVGTVLLAMNSGAL